MPPMDSLRSLLIDQLRHLYDGERRLVHSWPVFAALARNDQLRAALDIHLTQTEDHLSRLDRVFEELETSAGGRLCDGVRGLVMEGDAAVRRDFAHDSLRDVAIIGAAQRVEHYEIAVYGTALAHARLLELDGVIEILERTLREEKAADRKLTEIAERIVNPQAADLLRSGVVIAKLAG